MIALMLEDLDEKRLEELLKDLEQVRTKVELKKISVCLKYKPFTHKSKTYKKRQKQQTKNKNTHTHTHTPGTKIKKTKTIERFE
jgi:hypothetical protein